jgi:hypothetical protein
MGKRSNRRASNGAGRVQVAKQLTPFRVVNVLDTDAAGYTSGSLDCVIGNLGPRCVANSTDFEYWRFKSLKVSTIPAQTGVVDYATNGGVGYAHSVGFSPIPVSDFTLAPGSFTDMGNLNCFDMQPGNRRAGFQVPSGVLNSIPLKWARTRSNASTTDELSRGAVWFLVNLTVTETTGFPIRTWVELSGVVEFSGQVASADSLTSFVDRPIRVVSSELTEEKSLEVQPVVVRRPFGR